MTRDVEQDQAFGFSKSRSASILLHQEHDYSPTISHDDQRGNAQNNNWTLEALQEHPSNRGMCNPTISSSAQPPAGLCRSDSLWENHANHQQVMDIDHLIYTCHNSVINYGQQEQKLYHPNIPHENVLHLGSTSSLSRSHGKGIRSKVRVNPSTPGRSLIELMPAPAAGKKLIMEEILADGLTLTLCSRADPATMSFT